MVGDTDLLGDVDRVAAGPALARPTKKGPARVLLHRWIVDQVREIETLDPAVRRRADGGLHGMRKACRRLRAALATFGPLVDRSRTDPLRDELRWLARALGPARDDEVVLARIEQRLDQEDDELVLGRARGFLEQHAAARAAEDRADVGAVLSSQRYLDLRASLAALAEAPPWTERAGGRAAEVLPPLVRADWARCRRAHRPDVDPHELRKAAKRLRYAYELVEPAWGAEVERPRDAAKELTEILGDRQDSLVAREWLLALAAEAMHTGDTSFTFGRLHAEEEQREVELLGEAEGAWQALKTVRW